MTDSLHRQTIGYSSSNDNSNGNNSNSNTNAKHQHKNKCNDNQYSAVLPAHAHVYYPDNNYSPLLVKLSLISLPIFKERFSSNCSWYC